MKLALVSPWPPKHTGIADYAFDLAKGLVSLGHAVHVYTDVPDAMPLDGIAIHRVGPRVPNLDSFDAIIYQMGNNEFHQFILPMLQRYGGIVHLHDVVLHDFMLYLTYVSGRDLDYLGLVESWYGRIVAMELWRMRTRGFSPAKYDLITELPLFHGVLQYADSCVVHSGFGKRLIEHAFRDLPCLYIPQVYSGMTPASPPTGILRIGMFGGVDPYKTPEVAVRALAMVAKRGLDFTFDIAGIVHPLLERFPELIEELQLTDRVRLHGRVSVEQFHALMGATDVCIALRYPTRGETSAIVARAMQRGVGVVVNDIGWYSELPECVKKIPVRDSINSLATFIERMIVDPTQLVAIRRKTMQYAMAHLDFERTTVEYSEFILKCVASNAGMTS